MNSFVNRRKILDNFLKICAIDGWSNQSLKEASIHSGFNDGDELLIFEDGIYSLIDFFFEQGNLELKKESKKIDLKNLRVRDKIKELVKLRLDIDKDQKNALQSLTTISRGRKIPTLIKNSYNIADIIWKIAGDNSEDFNFYSKRIILSKVFTRVSLKFIADSSVDNKNSWKLLDEEIEKIMQISIIKEKFKKSKSYRGAKFICNFKERFKGNFKNNIQDLPFIRLFNSKY